MATTGGATGRLGPWEVDTAANELRREGATVRLEPKAMAVLAVLARNAGQAVTREQLLEEAWPGVVVGDAAVTQVVIKLRKALGDGPGAPVSIETIPKSGYRLRVRDEARPRPRATPAQRRAAAAFAAAMAVAGLAAWWAVKFGGDDDPASIARTAGLDEGSLARLAENLPTLSVRPFEVAGDDPRAATVARGLAWDLGERLGQASGLRLIGSDGRDSAVDRHASARYVVSGAVQSGPATVRVHAALTDRQSGEQLWSGHFEKPPQDALRVQEEIAASLVEVLPVKVGEAERRRMALPHTRSVPAFEAFLRGQAAFLVRTAEDNARARELFREAIALDPQFARAYAAVAMTHVEDYRLWRETNREESLAKARRTADAAFLINPASREVHWVRAYLAMSERRLAEAKSHVASSLAIDPSFADAYALLAWIHIFEGEPARAVAMMRTAMRLNPGAGHIYFAHIGTAYYFQGDSENALLNLLEARSRNPADVSTRAWLAAALLAAGRKGDAQWEAEEIRAMRPAFSGAAWVARMPIEHAGQRQRLSDAMAELGL